MSVSTYALVSLAELKGVIGIDAAATGQDATIEGVINRASEAIEAYLQRQIVTRGSLTEYHAMSPRAILLNTLQWPITSVTSVQEGQWSGSWTAAATLTAGTDYVADNAAGQLVRLYTFWQPGFDGVKVVYAAGYASTSVVPGPIKEVCLGLAARKYGQIRRGGDFGAQTTTDAMGTVSRFLPSELLKMEKDALAPWLGGNYAPTGRAV